MKDRVKATKLEAYLKNGCKDLEMLRFTLLKYCNDYQEVYPFDLLAEVEKYVNEILSNKQKMLWPIRGDIAELIEIGRGEYFISLNEISEAYAILLNEEPLNFESLKMAINHILSAFSCNEKEEDFLSREIDNLLKALRVCE